MKINKLRFKDNKQHWELSEISFDYLTLLVGASGVGKTKTLRAINVIKQIAQGHASCGIEWYVHLTTNSGDSYIWEGETDTSGISFPFFDDDFFYLLDDKDTPKTNFKWEKIYLNDNLILDRNSSETIYNNNKTVKLALSESIVSILKEEDSIKPIVEEFKRIKTQDLSSNKRGAFSMNSIISKDDSGEYSTIEEIRNSSRNIYLKLYLVSLYYPQVFEDIKDRYIEIFPLIEDIRIESRDADFTEKGKDKFLLISILIKEKGVQDWIRESDLSSGMYRSLIHIAEMHLCADGTLFLIDEFENSLGVNCINELTNEILLSDRRLQFIITSHHPYIINNIDFPFWKLVIRNGSTVRAMDINSFIQGQSSHDKFMQLIQLSQYQTGEE